MVKAAHWRVYQVVHDDEPLAAQGCNRRRSKQPSQQKRDMLQRTVAASNDTDAMSGHSSACGLSRSRSTMCTPCSSESTKGGLSRCLYLLRDEPAIPCHRRTFKKFWHFCGAKKVPKVPDCFRIRVRHSCDHSPSAPISGRRTGIEKILFRKVDLNEDNKRTQQRTV